MQNIKNAKYIVHSIHDEAKTTKLMIAIVLVTVNLESQFISHL